MESLAIGKNVIKMAVRRIFAAIDISDEVRIRVAEYSHKLKQEFRDVRARWERPEKFHITLRFEAKADDEMLKNLGALIKTVAETTPPFELSVSGTGAFINRRGPTVLWLGIDEIGQLAYLARSLNGQSAHKFHPHLTIARVKDPTHAARLIERHKESGFSAAVFSVNEIVLYESTLEPSGSKYSVLLREKLTG